jgi:hypothetical protein
VRPVAKYALIGVGALLALALAIAGASRLLERQQTAAEINRLREDLYRARAAADRCRGSLVNSESSLRTLGFTIDSLRSRVDSFEALDSRGVPAERYDEYMESFDGYNDSVAVWEGRERNLRAAEEACRATIEHHNALSDTLQQVLGDAGVEAG